MELPLKPDLQARPDEMARETGRASAELIEDAVAGYFDELDQTREALDRRFDDIESGRVQLIDGDEAMRLLREKSAAARNQS